MDTDKRRHHEVQRHIDQPPASTSIVIWTLRELIALLEAAESVPVKRGRYAKTRERRAAARNSD